MESCIYKGTVRHRRFSPVSHAFRYAVFFMYLDLAELPGLFRPYRLWSVEKPNIASFQRRDHLGDPRVPLRRAVLDRVEAHTGHRPGGAVRLLTHLRYFGYCFNPVSFFYCWDSSGTVLEAIVAEIHNTPWLETHPYVLGISDNEHPSATWRRHRFAKRFHVSPFMDMGLHYDWRFRVPGDRLNVHMRNLSGNDLLFDASLDVERREITARALSRVLLRYPPMTFKVTAMIYWNALRLRLKGAPFYAHPAKRNPNAEEVT
jgi:DUF1365 family protein